MLWKIQKNGKGRCIGERSPERRTGRLKLQIFIENMLMHYSTFGMYSHTGVDLL